MARIRLKTFKKRSQAMDYAAEMTERGLECTVREVRTTCEVIDDVSLALVSFSSKLRWRVEVTVEGECSEFVHKLI